MTRRGGGPPTAPGISREGVDLTVDLTRVPFQHEGDRHVASLDIDVFCGDDKEGLVGESWEKADLRLKDETIARLVKEGLPHSTRVALKGRVRYVKVIVHDYASDRLGSAVVKVR